MRNPQYILGAILALAVLYVCLPVMVDAYRRFRAPRKVICPETKAPATVEIDAARAVTSALDGTPMLEIERCSRWHGTERCGSECLAQIDPLGPAPRLGETEAA